MDTTASETINTPAATVRTSMSASNTAATVSRSSPHASTSKVASSKRQTTIVDGVCYDLSNFINTHPGGAELLLLAVDRDASILFHSYHRRLGIAQSVLSSLPIIPMNSLDHLPSPVFGRKNLPSSPEVKPTPTTSTSFNHLESDLYNEMRGGVNKYFSSLPRGADGKEQSSRGGMMIKTVVLLNITAMMYALVILKGWWWLTPLLGVVFAINGLAIQHDANHGAFSEIRVLNLIAGFMDDLIGGSGLMWRHQHVLSHHAYPNDVEWDGDTFSHYPILRLNPASPPKWWHQYQHYYILIAHAFIGFEYLIGDIRNYFKGSYEHIVLHKLRPIDHFLFFFGKFIHFTVALFIPLAVFPWRMAVIQIYLPLELFGGLYLALLFAISHNTEMVEYNLPKDESISPSGTRIPCWAEMQIRTACNWSCHSKLWLWASGGLNFQIEHHLFPGIAHKHYPAIHPIVKAACIKRNIPYNDFPTFTAIFLGHLSMIKKLGQADYLGPEGEFQIQKKKL